MAGRVPDRDRRDRFPASFFLSLINRLSRELHDSVDNDYQDGLLNELVAYARFHFTSEENMMLRDQYPNLDEHRQHHRTLLDQLSTRVAKLELDRSTAELSRLVEFLVGWFVHHTLSEDKQYASFSLAG